MAYYRNEVLTDSPYLYLTFENGSLDSNLGSYSGSLSSSAGGYALATGKIGKAPDFTGPATAARIGYTASGGGFSTPLNTNSWTIEMHFKVDAFASGYMSLFQYNDGSNLIDALFDFSDSKKLKVRHKAQGGTLYTISTTHTQNTSWHHLAITRSGTTLTVYVDGSSVGSTTIAATNPNFSTSQVFYVGAYGSSSANDNFDGLIDEIAVYTSNLSSGRITAHSGADMTGGGYTAQAMTASAAMPDAVGAGNIQTKLVTSDTEFFVGGSMNNKTATTITLNTGNPLYLAFRASDFVVGGSETITSAKLRFYVSSASAAPTTLTFSKINSAWTEASTNIGTYTFVKTVTQTVTTGWNEYDITEIAQAWEDGTYSNYGIAVTAPATAIFTVHAHENGSNQPSMIATIMSDTSVNPSATPMTASALVVDPTVSVTVSGGYSATPMTASAAMPDPTIDSGDGVSASGQPFTASASMPTVTLTIDHDEDVAADPMTASAAMGANNGFAVPAGVTASPVTASALTVEPGVTVQKSAVYVAQAMGAAGVWNAPEEINGEPIALDPTQDRFYVRAKAIGPKYWYRLNTIGNDIPNAGWYGDPGYVLGVNHGVITGRHDAPDGRHNYYFNGNSSIEQMEPSGSNVDETTILPAGSGTTLEFAIRTTKKNQFIMVAKDDSQRQGLPAVSEGRPVELWLQNGRLQQRNKTPGSANTSGNYNWVAHTGFKDIADGEWHYISIKSKVGGGSYNSESGFEILIDGQLDIRRYGQGIAFSGFPDWIGWRPDYVDGFYLYAISANDTFVGDMSEVAFYTGILSESQTQRLYYDFMGWTPIEVAPIDAFAFTPAGHRGRGNQKRALVLNWYARDDRLSVLGYPMSGDPSVDVNFNPALGNPSDLYGYKMFYKSVTENSASNRGYRDPVTDEPTIINLKTDVDILDYDVIMFKDWPDEGAELDEINYFWGKNGNPVEKLVADLRWANNLGIGLLVTHPRQAVDLGVVDRIETVSSLRETRFLPQQGNALGLFDYGSAVKFPWNISATSGLEGWAGDGSRFNGEPMNTDPAFLVSKAYFYGDTNKNDRYRVRATIEGLTDIPSYMIEEAVYQSDADTFGWQIVGYKYLHADNGLQIGDEFIFHGSDMGYNTTALSADYDAYRFGRHNYTFAAPLANVKAGTVVTTFGAKLFDGFLEVDNPYRNYATTIVLKRGDQLAGTPVGGRIFVNFTEQPSWQPTAVATQVLPEDDADFPNSYNAPDTEAQREWEWSDTRKSLRSLPSTPAPTNITVALPGGGTTVVAINSQSTLPYTRSKNIFPVEWHQSLQMVTRGLFWIAADTDLAPGDVNPATSALAASATMPSPTVVAKRDTVITTTPATALAAMPKVAEDESGVAQVNTLPMTAEATFGGFGKTFSAEPMTASAELVDNLGLVDAQADRITLTLYGVNQEITLYLKEEA